MSIPRKGRNRENINAGKTKNSEGPVPEKEGDLAQPRNIGEQLWCPLCNKQVQLLRVSNAAKLVDVHPRTIYRYIDEGLVFALKVAGKTYRVCRHCLLRQYPDS
jgi:excisionase family DNA binding protein